MPWTKEEAARVASLEAAVASLTRRVAAQGVLIAHLSGRTRRTLSRPLQQIVDELEQDAAAMEAADVVEGGR